MTGGQPFVYLLPCGCVFSQAGLKTVSGASPNNGKAEKDKVDAEEGKNSKTDGDEELDLCPQCGTKFSKSSDVLAINPSSEEEERMWLAMERRRASEPPKTKSKKRKAADSTPSTETSSTSTKKKKGSPDVPSPSPALNSTAPSITTVSRTLASSLAAEEAKRKAGMSDAVRSLYRSKDDRRKETFMTMGTFTRYA